MKQLLILAAILASALAGPQTCQKNFIYGATCSTLDDHCANEGPNAYCHAQPLGINVGLCDVETFECPVGTQCYGYSCQVPPGQACVIGGDRCAEGTSCVGGICKCASVPINQCFWANDAVGASIPGLTVCANTNRTCRMQTTSNPYGYCIAPNGAQCDGDTDCAGNSCFNCKCGSPDVLTDLCKHYTGVVTAMKNFETCLSSYTSIFSTPNSGPMVETMCDIGAANCKYHLHAAHKTGDSYLANIIEDRINTETTDQLTKFQCSYRKTMSFWCKMNLHFI